MSTCLWSAKYLVLFHTKHFSLEMKKAGKTSSNWSSGDNQTNWDRLYWFGCSSPKLVLGYSQLWLPVSHFGVKKLD